MRIKILVIMFLLFATNCFAAELLVRAKPHWMDNFLQADIDKMSIRERQSYEARSQEGDIIVVRPDGWVWGKEECLPNFVIIKIPDLKIEDAMKYQESLMDGINYQNPVLLKQRKYQIPKAVIDNARQLSQTNISVSKQQSTTFISNIIQKTK